MKNKKSKGFLPHFGKWLWAGMMLSCAVGQFITKDPLDKYMMWTGMLLCAIMFRLEFVAPIKVRNHVQVHSSVELFPKEFVEWVGANCQFLEGSNEWIIISEMFENKDAKHFGSTLELLRHWMQREGWHLERMG